MASYPPEPVPTHLGKVTGEWPIVAFTSEDIAASWAAEDRIRRRVWPITTLVLGGVMVGAKVPERYILIPPEPPGAAVADEDES